MRCSSAKKLISLYIDGDLDSRKSSHLEKHLEECQDCQKLLKDFERMAKSNQELETLSPSPQTWLKIRERLAAEEQKILGFERQKRSVFSLLSNPPLLKYALSASFLLAFIIGGLVLGLRYWRGKEVPSGEKLRKYTLARLNEAERNYELAIKALWKAASAQENIDPQLAEVFKRNLEIIDSSIAACRQILLQNPEDIEARNYLLAVYRRKLDVLHEMMVAKEASSLQREFKTVL